MLQHFSIPSKKTVSLAVSTLQSPAVHHLGWWNPRGGSNTTFLLTPSILVCLAPAPFKTTSYHICTSLRPRSLITTQPKNWHQHSFAIFCTPKKLGLSISSTNRNVMFHGEKRGSVPHWPQAPVPWVLHCPCLLCTLRMMSWRMWDSTNAMNLPCADSLCNFFVDNCG